MKKHLFFLSAIVFFAPFIINAQAPSVTNISPAPHIINAPADAAIIIDFENPIDPSTISEQTVRVFGKWSGPASGAFSLMENNTQVVFLPSENFFVGEWVVISLTKNIKSETKKV